MAFEKLKTKPIGADLSKVVDRITRQYEDLSEAFQKEAIQNSWDARLDKKEAKEWKVKIYTYTDDQKNTHLIVEDFGTTGMNKKRWKAFLSLWKPEKHHLDAGGQGQGKFVLMGASNDHILIVESISDSLSYRCKFLRDAQKYEDDSKSIKDFIAGASRLNHKGTKIWVYNVKKEFLKSIKSKDFLELIEKSWWQVLKDRFEAKIFIFGKRIHLSKLPPVVEEKLLFKNKKLKKFGKIKRLVLRLYKDPIPRSHRGIRVQRANMMVTKIPFRVYEKEYKNRFSGYIEFDYDLEKPLKKIEKTDHCGFLYKSPWKDIKKIVKEEAEKFVDKIIPQKKKKKPLRLKNINKAIQKANQIIKDNCSEVMSSDGSVPPDIPPPPYRPLRIDYLTISDREVKYGDTIKSSCKIVNETQERKKILLEVHLKHKGRIISDEEHRFKINSGKPKLKEILDLKLKKRKYSKGKYTLRTTIKKNRHKVHSKATSFYLETKRKPTRRGFVKKVKLIDSNLPIRNWPINKGTITVNLAHKDFMNIYNSLKRHKRKRNKQINFYIIKICLDEAINKMLKLRLENPQKDTEDLINDLSRLRDRMYHEIYL